MMKLYLLLIATLVASAVANPPNEKESSEESSEGFPGLLMRGEPLAPKPRTDDRPHFPDGGPRPEIHEKLPEAVEHPDEEKPLVRCKRPICRMFCEHGFHVDKYGCPTCKCIENPCESEQCGEQETCVALPDCHSMPCTQLKHECLPNVPCAMPMCANHCPDGYKTDKMGCMRCECKETVCEGHICPTHHKCVSIPIPFCKPGQRCGSKPMCLPIGHEENFHPHGDEPHAHDGIDNPNDEGFPQPMGEVYDKICLFRQKFADELVKQTKKQLANHTSLNSFLGSRAMHRPRCKENGDFHDMQCHFPDRQCWCVDDRGNVLTNTLRNILKKEDLPECIPHKTMSLEGTFLINHELENVKEHIEHIKTTLLDHMSKWLQMDREFIIITKIQVRDTKENVIIIEFSIKHDGKTDLTALERQLLWHFHQKHGSIPFLQTFLQPQPQSLKVTHHAEPMLPEHGLWQRDPKKETCFSRFYHHHKTATIAGGIVGGSVFILLIIAVIITVCKRRKMSAQFKHKRMTEKSEKYKQNLAYANEELSGGKVDLKGDVVKVAEDDLKEVQA